MSIKWGLLRDRLKRFMGENTFTDDDLADYATQALAAVTTHTARERVYTYTVAANATLSALELPDDVFEVGPVLVSHGTTEKHLYKPYRLAPGAVLPTATVAQTLANHYYRWGSQLRFLVPVPADRQIEVFYFAYWQPVDNEADVIPIPRWMEEPIMWYCQHLAMSKSAASAARLRTYNTKQDSGNPEHNSRLEYAKFCLRRYEQLMAEQPSQDRTGWEGKA